MRVVDIRSVPLDQRTQTPFDLFVLFAGAYTVATTLQVGASLATGISGWAWLTIIGPGVLLGSPLVAALAPIGPRLGVPSIIAVRAALGIRGGAIGGASGTRSQRIIPVVGIQAIGKCGIHAAALLLFGSPLGWVCEQACVRLVHVVEEPAGPVLLQRRVDKCLLTPARPGRQRLER